MNWFKMIKQKSDLLQIIEESMSLFKNNPKWQKYDSFYPNDAKILHDLITNDNNWQQAVDNKYGALGPVLKLIGESAIEGRAIPPNFQENIYFTPQEIENIKGIDRNERRHTARLSGDFDRPGGNLA
tara:strand:+ start:2599 stop:2979 length:381 start_codon:yes stop_codon:yes gene_type:complete